jgi:hypothetical protein
MRVGVSMGETAFYGERDAAYYRVRAFLDRVANQAAGGRFLPRRDGALSYGLSQLAPFQPTSLAVTRSILRCRSTQEDNVSARS